MTDFSGKVALVTGSSMGLGRAFAMDLAKAGATVVVNDPFGGEPAESVVKEIEDNGGKAVLVVCDIGDEKKVSEMIDVIVDRFNKVDILINNAGISIDATTMKYNALDWDKVLRVNLSGAFYCSKLCLPSMVKQNWGRIISISSVVGQIGVMGTPAYTASKAGLMGFTKTMAKEVARKGVTANCISLGYFQGGGLLDTVPEKVAKTMLSQVPVGRFGKPEEICSAIRFLASDEASYITGHTLNINGGLYTQ